MSWSLAGIARRIRRFPTNGGDGPTNGGDPGRRSGNRGGDP
ncbi:MAG: hypothetical protein OXU61_07770 [Gammaproteobacteria bacterium]|nr:hypothetical protein [Gammaproteobacteria bacterium]